VAPEIIWLALPTSAVPFMVPRVSVNVAGDAMPDRVPAAEQRIGVGA